MAGTTHGGLSSLHLLAPELAAALPFFPNLDFSQGIEPCRAALMARALAPTPDELEVVVREERRIPGLDGHPAVRVLLYRLPCALDVPRPAVLHIHGGGFVLGDPEINDAANRDLALHSKAVVISVDYRLAPETRFPGARDDCYAVLVWMHASAAELGIDPARIALAGESAGAGHAVALALHARDRGGPAVCFQLLDAPMLDDRTGCGGNTHPYCGQFVWTAEKNVFGWRSLLGVEPGGPDVPIAAVPARASNLSGLPPTFISVGALDLFVEEDLEFARRLVCAGVAVELHVVPGAYHGFGIVAGSPQALQLGKLRRRALARALEGRNKGLLF